MFLHLLWLRIKRYFTWKDPMKDYIYLEMIFFQKDYEPMIEGNTPHY